MRKTFIDTLTEMARADDKIMCVIGDTGFSVFEDFEKEFGERFLNVGIAEQNFVSMGAGMAAMGLKPYIYNVVSFMTLRSMEQILFDVCYQENSVVMVGVGGGFAYGTAGPSHHALHDIAMMSEIPNLTVVCPGDPVEMRAVMLASKDYGKPMYIRIGRSIDPVIHRGPIDFKIGKSIKIREGKDVTIFTTGTILKESVAVCDILREKGIEASLYSMHTIKPIDKDCIIDELKKGKPIFTIEEHSLLGGLGDAVGRVILDNMNENANGNFGMFRKFGVTDDFAPITGNRDYLLNVFGLSEEKIVESILKYKSF